MTDAFLDLTLLSRPGEVDVFHLERVTGDDTSVNFEISSEPRGLTISSLTIEKVHDGIWGWASQREKVYFTSIGFDLSSAPPRVSPPSGVVSVPYSIRQGETVSFTLGDGFPLWGPSSVTGALFVYVVLSESDETTRRIGEVMSDVDSKLTGSDGLIAEIKGLLTNPTQAVAKDVLGVASSALSPVATILADNKDDTLALFAGGFPATTPWSEDHLSENRNGCVLTLREV